MANNQSLVERKIVLTAIKLGVKLLKRQQAVKKQAKRRGNRRWV